MRTMKTLVMAVCVFALAGSVPVQANCCRDAKKAGKECAHKCCIDAAKARKVCEKCHPKTTETKEPEKRS